MNPSKSLLVVCYPKLILLEIFDRFFVAINITIQHFINEIYENTSIILTSNKSPNDWGQLIGDEIITGAILDRIIQRSEIIQLSGDSYRLKHRKGIFEQRKKPKKVVQN